MAQTRRRLDGAGRYQTMEQCPHCHEWSVYEREFWAPKPDQGHVKEGVCFKCGWSEVRTPSR